MEDTTLTPQESQEAPKPAAATPPPLPEAEETIEVAAPHAPAKGFPRRFWDSTGLHASRMIYSARDAALLGEDWTDEAPKPGRPAPLAGPAPHAKLVVPGLPNRHDPDGIHSRLMVPRGKG